MDTDAFDDTEEAETFDDGTAEVGDGETKASSKSADLVDMTDKNPIQVTNANISSIMHSDLVNATLEVTKTPVTAKGTVKWTSSNKKVATVSSKGVVTAKKKGTATVTAKFGNKKVTFKVTVK